MRAALAAGLALLLAAPVALADPPRERSDRETELDQDDIDDAISDAQESADEFAQAVDDMLEDGGRDAQRREAWLRREVDSLVAALARLRADHDEDGDWSDQRAEARTAWMQWKKLDPKIRHHWASETHEAFRDLHEDLRRLARIYQIDSPPRR
jgi:hypothetical protein